MIVVDLETLQAVMPRVAGAKGLKQAKIVAGIAGSLHDTLGRYQITTPLRIAHFLAQIAHESDGFCTCEEYASGAAYEGRADLGNDQPGDGVRFKGRGLIQLTGRRNYRVYGQRIGIDLVADPPRAEEAMTALVLACEYWTQTAGGLNRFADRDDIISITRAINGGLNGLDDRRRYLARAKQALARTLAAGIALGQPDGALQVLRRGMSAPGVEGLQRALAKAGFPVAIDGEFGPGTEAMVRAFQRARGLGDDGVVGPATWAALGGPAAAEEVITLVPQGG
ncbi:peptidoglycan-binding protein [Sphingomonas parva]|uniref:Peptidoglycan-binding protein n=1 Tax=Sphingomonas parva TaxID=2555898 RepID=A0A4Y8ZVB8_9SPHN|nr:peptidoglycan-binding protein [Sphingomonas parva]TFI58396.1 peptidoglycan-binding protein [Sphingomonas parva]